MADNSNSEKHGFTDTGLPEDSGVNIAENKDDMRSGHANVTGVTAGREEFVLQFGITGTDGPSPEESLVHTTHRVTLSPFAAKRLAALLDSTMRDYEIKFGPLSKESRQSKTMNLDVSVLPSYSRTEFADEKVERLFQLIGDLGINVGFERSVKIFKGTLLANRFLVGFKKDVIKGNRLERIQKICKGINMPEDYLDAFSEELPEANIVLYGFEANEARCFYKAYLEFGDRFDKLLKKNLDYVEPFVVHTGYKWDTLDNSKRTVAKYKCLPVLSTDEIIERLSTIFYTRKHKIPFKIAEDILNLASKTVNQYEVLYLEVEEENNPRRSFDINIYRANIRMESIYHILSRVCDHYSISSDDFHSLYEPVKDQIFGHLSGGVDREGRDFLTFYFGVKGSTRVPGL